MSSSFPSKKLSHRPNRLTRPRNARGSQTERKRRLAFEALERRSLMASDVSDGGLQIEVIPAYNLIIDSNVETPATYAPRAAHLGVKVTNTGTTALTGIEVNFGSFDVGTGTGTAGIYPVTSIPESDPIRDYWGDFSFVHEGGVIDATRPVIDLAPGESTVIYVLVSYPNVDERGESVAGAAPVVEDDLRLDYDVWATASQGGQDLLVYDERYMVCRNELSAMANKVYPNTTGKVPDEYLDAIEASLGWRPAPDVPRIPGAYLAEGIWYDLGNVGAGFDNDGDLIPDRNAWLQPVGDPDLYDASSTRLVKTYGLLIIKLNDGTEQLVPFEDQLYFQHIPENNTGVVGLVYYEFLPLSYGGSSILTPYQEVASGYDNEKFNGDFGSGTSSVSFAAPQLDFDKSGPISVGLNNQATFTLSVTNNDSTDAFGFPAFSLPPVIVDSIPAGTTYVAGSARAVTLPSGQTAKVRYSTDGGATWSEIEPNAELVTDLQWWLNGELAPGETFTVEFRVSVPSDYEPLVVENCGGVSLGGNESFLQDCHVVSVSGPYKIGDTVFADSGAGGGIVGDGVQNGTEAGLANIGVSLYIDSNGNGLVDPQDLLLQTTTTNASGYYEFTGLRDGDYLVAVDKTDPDRPEGWVVSTLSALEVTVAGADNLTADFGFSPALDVEKTLLGTSPVNEGSLISYRLDVTNLMKPDGYEATLSRTLDLWMTTASGTFATPSAAAGDTTGTFATSGTNGQTLIASNPIDPALIDQRLPIVHVEAALDLRVSGPFSSNDFLTLRVTRAGSLVGTYQITRDAINSFVSATTTGTVSVNLTDIPGGWTWADLTAANTTLEVTYTKSSQTTSTVSIDRLGMRVTTVAPQTRDGQLFWSDVTTTFKSGPTSGGEMEILMPSLAGSVSDAAYDEVNNVVYVSYGTTIDTRTPDGTFIRSFTTTSTVTGLDVAPADGKLFWSEANAIKSANLDGTGVMTIVSGLNSVQGLAVDPGAQQVFWIQSNANTVKINRANFDGSGQVVIYDGNFGLLGNKNPRDIEIDPQSGKIYFTSAIGTGTSFVGVVNADGTNPTVLVNGLTTPTGLALDIDDGMMFWADSQGIKSATLNGTAVTTVYPNLDGVKELEIPFFSLDTIGTFDIDKTLSYVPLTDDYDPAKLRFVSASIAPSSVDTVTGLITWDNVGDINPNITKSIIVTFEVLEPAGNATDANTLNTASVVDATTATGLTVNDDLDTVTITVNPTASIGDFIWQDRTGGTNGVYNVGIDAPIPGVKVELRSADGSTVLATTFTDATGFYSFDGLVIPDGASTTYQVWVDTTTLPTGAVNTFDASGTLDSRSTLTLSNPAGATGPSDNLSQDFAYTFTNAIVYGNLWNDYDADATRDPLDEGLAGVTVRLLNSSGTVIATTTTLADGSYRFPNVAPGNYTIEVLTTSLPASTGTWAQTAELPAETAFDGTLSNQIAISVSSGEINGANDFGYTLEGTASIGDQVFFDLDQDLVQDVGEEGIPGVSVNLFYDADRNGLFDASIDPLVATTVTAADGTYLFSDLAAGTYFVAVDETDADFPNNVTGLVENPTSALVYSGTARLDVDFPYYPYGDGAISGSVWNDKNFDEQFGGGEAFLPAIEVQLWVDLNGDGTYQLFATTSTDASGNYVFENLPYADYQVILNTADPEIPLSYAGNPYSPTTPTTSTITLSPANPTDEANFGLAALPSIGDFVFFDDNANGTQDPSETGIGGVTVRLFLDTNGDGIADGPAIATTTTAIVGGTAPVGYYQFAEVQPTGPGESYIVVVDTTTLPYPMLNSADPDRDGVAWTGTADAFPAADSSDSGITVTSTSYSGADFGYVPRGVIGDYVWIDIDGDQFQDPNEVGLAGVTVTVTNGTTTYTTLTDADGRYSFANIPAGTWTVSISGSPLATMAPTYDADGGLNNSTTVTINASGQVTNPFGSLGIDFGVQLDGPYILSGTVVTNDSRTPGIADDVDNFLDDGDDLDVGDGDETELGGQMIYLYQLVGSSYLLVSTTTTDAEGDYEFTNLPNGEYKVVLDSTSVPLQNTELTTTAAVTPATAVTNTGTSVIQSVTIAGADVLGVDYAFVSTVAYDFGDLPNVYNASGISNDGARHIIPESGSTIYLGTAPDADSDGAGSPYADGDDRIGTDDEDGVQPFNIASWVDGPDGGQLQITIAAGQTGYLVGWIDFNHDNTLIDQGEMIISQVVVGTGTPQTFTFDIPLGTIDSTDESWLSRFRIFTEAPAFPLFSYTGVAVDGEVEDYLFRRTVGAAIGDRVWMDTDGDGVQDDNEFGIPGVTVDLKDAGGTVIASMETSDGTQDVDGDGVIDPVGYYRFKELPTGTYSVEVTVPTGYVIGFDEDDGTTSPDGVTAVVLTSSVQHLTADFGLVPDLADISGSVFYDANHNDLFGGDTGFGAVTVQLWTDPNGDGDPSDGVQVAETYTATDGSYLFEDVPSYSYVIIEVDPYRYTSDADTVGSLTDNKIPVVLAGVDSTGNDFLDDGPTLMSLSGTVYNDGGPGPSANNAFDASDTPIGGVTLTLFLDADGDGLIGPTDPLIDTTVTAADGTYTFPNLPAGSYLIRETDPAGFGSDSPNLLVVTLATTSVTGVDFLDDERSADGDLSVTKTDGRTENIPGGTTVYTLVFANSGPTFASGARVLDNVPSELTGVTWTATYTGSGSTGPASGSGDLDALIDLAASGTATFTITGTILTTFTDVLTNTAEIVPPADFIDANPGNNTATDTTDIVPAADLAITKVDNKAIGTPGESLTYTIVVTNNGPSDVVGAAVQDYLPETFLNPTWTVVYAGVGATGPASGIGNIDTSIDLPSGATATFTVSGTIASSATGALLNTATVAVPTGYVDTDLTNNSDTEDTPLVPKGDLQVTKTDGLTDVLAGQTITYTIEVLNAGPSDAVGARVNDPLPAVFSNVTWTASYANGASGPTAGTGSLVNVLVNLPAAIGAKATFLVTGTISAAATPGSLTNTVSVAAPSGFTETNLANNSATDVDTLERGGDLSITKSDGVTTTSSGSTLLYTIVVTNHGPSDVTGVTVTDTLPADLTFVSATGGAIYDPGAGTVTFVSGTIAAGGSTSFVINATVATVGATTITNTASLLPPADYTDSDSTNNSATDTTDVLSAGYDLQVTKTDGLTSVLAGATLTYTIVVSNSGPDIAANVSIADSLPPGLLNPTWTTAADAGVLGVPASGSGNIAITGATIPSGQSVTFLVSGTVSAAVAGQTLTNTVNVSADGTDVNLGNNEATDTTGVVPQADLQVAKSSTSPVVPGQNVTYTILVTNNGPISVTGATVVDALPSGTTFVSATGGATYSNGTVSYTSGTLVNGGTESFTVTLAVAPTLVGTLSNTATVSPPNGVVDPVPGNNTATDTDPLTPIVDLRLVKTSTQTQAIPGLLVQYTIEVTNLGPSFASGATVTDALPATLHDAIWEVVYTGANAGGPVAGTGNINTQIDLPVNGTATFTIFATLDPSATGTLTNTASVAVPLGYTDPTPANNSDPESLPITPTGNLSLTKVDDRAIGIPGEALVYTIVVTNQGPSDVTDAIVSDLLPAGLTNASWNVAYSPGSSGSASSGSGSISGLLVDLLAGGTATITVTGTISPSATGTLSNTATVTAPAGFTDNDPSDNADTEETPLEPRGDLSITKTDGLSSTDPGSPITYTIVVSNAGPNDATAAILNDTIPASILNATWTASYSVGSSGPASGSGSISAASLNLLSGGTATFTVSGTVSNSASGTITNTATITPPVGFRDTNSDNNSATDTTVLDQNVDLVIAKTNNLTAVIPGRNTTYTITVTNNGPINVTGATVTDVLPAGTTFVAATGGATYDSLTRTVSYVSGQILATNSASFTITVAVAPTLAGNLVNTATVAPPAGITETDTNNNSATDTDPLTPQADLRIGKTNNLSSVIPGNNTTYTLTVTNDGPSTVTGATVTDVLPAGTTFVSATGGATYDSGTNTVSFVTGTLATGGSTTFSITLGVSQSLTGTLSNTATVAPPAGVFDPHLPDNTATDSDPLRPSADLRVSKTNGATSLLAGTETTYTIVVTNDGPSQVTGALVADTLPAGLIFVSATGGAAYDSATHTVNYLSGVLASGGTTSFTVTALVSPTASGTLTNTVTVTPPTGVTDPHLPDNAASDTDPVVPSTNLKIVKSNGLTAVIPGEEVTYTITVTNEGPAAVSYASVTDTLPAALEFLSATGGLDYDEATGHLNGITPSLAVGESYEFTVTALVSPTAAGRLTNTASVAPPPDVLDSTPGDNVSTDDDPLTPSVNLTIAKSNGVDELVPGETTQYTITVTNAGPSTVTGATVVDVLPVGTTFVSASGDAGYFSGTNSVRYVLGTLAADDSVEFTITLLVSASASGNLANTATVQPPAGVAELDPTDNSATDTDPLIPTADLGITKSNGVSALIPGTQTTYTVTVSNAGPSTVSGATVSDVLPAGLTFVSATGGATHSGGTVSYTTGTLASGGMVSFTITVLVDASATGNLANTATVQPPAGVAELDPTDNSATDTDPLNPTANLGITKSNGVSALIPGNQTTYTVTVSNAGPSTVSGATVSDVLPAGLTFVSATGGATHSGGTVSYTTGTLASGDSTSFTITVLVDASATGSLSNTATVAPPAGVTDPTPGDNSATDTDPLNPTADLGITKSNGVSTLIPGTQTTYTVTVSNAGPSTVSGATVSDVLPAGLTFVSATGGATHSGGTVSYTTGTLASGDSTSFTITVLVDASATGSLSNTATVAPPAGVTDPTPGDNAATDTDPLVRTADLSITKSNGVDELSPGIQTTYTISVVNAGPSSVSGATVSDVLPAGLTFVSATGGATHSGGTVSYTTGTLASGGTASFTITVLVDNFATGSLSNTATVAPPAGVTDPTPGDNSSTDTDPIEVLADLRLTKSNSLAAVVPGTQMTYTFGIANDGPHAVAGAYVEDILPAGLTYVSASSGVSYDAPTRTVRYVARPLSVNGTDSFTVTVAVASDLVGTISNTASVYPPVGVTDPDPSDNSATDTDPIGGDSDLSITKTNGSEVYREGGTSVYTIVVRNLGDVPVQRARVRDAVTAQMTSATWTATFSPGSSGTTSGVGGIDQWIDLAAGGVATYSFRTTIGLNTPGKLVNTATVEMPAGFTDTDPSNNSDTDTDKLPIVVTGTEVGCKSAPFITVIDPYTGAIRTQFNLFEPKYRGGVRVALGDLDGDGIDEIIAAPGSGRLGEILVFRLDGTPMPAYRTVPFGTGYKSGVEIAVGDIDGDGIDDIVASAARGPGDVRVFRVTPGAADPVPDTPFRSFRAFDAKFQGGATVAVADMGTFSNGSPIDRNVQDGRGEIIIGSGTGMAPQVLVYDVSGSPTVIDSFAPMTSTPKFRNGVSVSTGRFDADAIPDVIVSAGRSGGTAYEIYNGKVGTESNALLARDAIFTDIANATSPLFSVGIDLDGDNRIDELFNAQGDNGTRPYPGIRVTDTDGDLLGTFSALNFSQRIAASAPRKSDTLVTTPTGLLYEDVVVGTGARPVLGQTVSIHYIASNQNGAVLQNTHLTGLPLNFTLGNSQVLAGLNEAVASMRVGGRRQVVIPANLASGSTPSGLPANTPLVFDIELLSVGI